MAIVGLGAFVKHGFGLMVVAAADHVPQSPRAEYQQNGTGGDQEWPHSFLHIAQEDVRKGNPQQRTAEEDEHNCLNVALHSSHHPTMQPQMIATTKVAGAKRLTNLRPNVPPCNAINFKSTIGPTTRKTSREISGN